MTAPVFVDTNVLVYAHDRDAGAKQQRAAACLKELWQTRGGRLSTQVLQECYVNVTQKTPLPVSRALARDILRDYAAWVHPTLPQQPYCELPRSAKRGDCHSGTA